MKNDGRITPDCHETYQIKFQDALFIFDNWDQFIKWALHMKDKAVSYTLGGYIYYDLKQVQAAGELDRKHNMAKWFPSKALVDYVTDAVKNQMSLMRVQLENLDRVRATFQ